MALSTYTAGSNTDLNRVRRAINDTSGVPTWAFEDVEILDFIAERGVWQGAVAECYRALAGRCARQARDMTTKDGSINEVANFQPLLDMARDWDKRATAASAASAVSTIPRAIVGHLGTSPSDRTDTRS